MGWTLDTGILIAAERSDRRYLEFRRAINEVGEPITIPAVVLAESWRGARNVRITRALAGCELEDITPELAMAAGALCGRAKTDDPVDAIVVMSAAWRGDTIVTTDPADLRQLAAAAGMRTRVLSLDDL